MSRIGGLRRYSSSLLNLFGRALGLLTPALVFAVAGSDKSVDDYVVAYGFNAFISGIIGPIVEVQTTTAVNKGHDLRSIVSNIRILDLVAIIGAFLASILAAYQLGLCYGLVPLLAGLSVRLGVFQGYLIAQEKWTPIFLSQMLRLGLIALVAFCGLFSHPIHGIICGLALGEIVRFIFLNRICYNSKLMASAGDNKLDVRRQSLYQIPSHILNGLVPLGNRLFASAHGIQNLIFLDLAEKAFTGVVLLFANTWLTVEYNRWMKSLTNSDVALRGSVVRAGVIGAVLGIFASVCVVMIMSFLLPTIGTYDMRRATVVYLLGLPPYLITMALVKFFIMKSKSYVMSIVSLLATVLNLSLSYVFIPVLHLTGVALSNSIAMFVTCAILFFTMLGFTKSRPA